MISRSGAPLGRRMGTHDTRQLFRSVIASAA